MMHTSNAPQAETDLINLIGYPGAGKDTQMAFIRGLLRREGKKHEAFGVGEALRREREHGTELGLEAAPYLDAGVMAPTPLVLPAINAYARSLHENPKTRDSLWIFNGVPRTPDQIGLYENIVRTYRRRDLIVLLSLGSHEDARRIMRERARDRAEEAVREGLVPRSEDLDPEACVARYNEAREKLDPMIDYFRLARPGRLLEVNASETLEDVQASIRAGLEKLGVLPS